MRARQRFVSIIAALLVTVGASQAADSKPLRIGLVIWVGFGPLYVAQEKGFFAQEGIEVELINMAHSAPLFAGLHARQIDVSVGTLDEMLPYFDPEDPYACFLADDESTGGDGIVANKDIKSIADLKGKMVALSKGTTLQLLLNVLLKKAGLSKADVETVDLEAEDASNAFLMQEVDAAVVWEPWLTQGKQAPHGHLLADSSETPGLIVDCLTAMVDVFQDRLAEFRALARAWDAAVHYVEAHPNEANEIMARHVGGGFEDPAIFGKTLKGLRFYDAARNREFFGTSDNPGQIYETMQYAIDFRSSLGALEADITPADVIRHDLWTE